MSELNVMLRHLRGWRLAFTDEVLSQYTCVCVDLTVCRTRLAYHLIASE